MPRADGTVQYCGAHRRRVSQLEHTTSVPLRAPRGTTAERLTELQTLLVSGLINQSQFDQKQVAILEEL
jgi:hypothetical protein